MYKYTIVKPHPPPSFWRCPSSARSFGLWAWTTRAYAGAWWNVARRNHGETVGKTTIIW